MRWRNNGFFRDSFGLEVDLIHEDGIVPRPIEIKSAITYTPALYKSLQKFCSLEPTAVEPTLIYGGADMGTLQGIRIVSYRKVAEMMH